MTVKELIEELKCFEEDKEVWLKIDGNYSSVNEVDLDDDEEFIVIF